MTTPVTTPVDLAKLIVSSAATPKDAVLFLSNATVEAMKLGRPIDKDERAWLLNSLRELRDSLDKAIAQVEATK